MKIDAHVHYLPPQLQEGLDELVRREPYWGKLLRPPSGKSVQAYATAEQMLADMDRAEIDRVILVGEYYQRQSSCVARNNETIELVQRYPERVIGLAVVQPLAGQEAIAELERCQRYGLAGVGELNPWAQGVGLHTAEFGEVAAWCMAANWPMNLHINEEVGGFYWGKGETPIRHYYEFASAYPELQLVLAHWGGGLIFYELLKSARPHLANVYYDTAASPLQYNTAEVFAAALACAGGDKILYGSDYPLRLYPRSQRQADFVPFLAEIEQVPMTEAMRAAVMGGNAAKVYGRQGEEDGTAVTEERPAL